jgi:WD repeat-containing protein 48
MEAKNQPKKRTQLSFIIRDPVEKLNRSGINCIRFQDSQLSKSDRRLFTAGRDSIIRVYNNFSYAETTPHDLNNAEKYYQMSLSHHTDWVNDIVVCKRSNTSII